jgi:hypothetical protein
LLIAYKRRHLCLFVFVFVFVCYIASWLPIGLIVKYIFACHRARGVFVLVFLQRIAMYVVIYGLFIALEVPVPITSRSVQRNPTQVYVKIAGSF